MDDEEEQSEPKQERGELKGGYSPFGVMWRVQKETGWTDDHLLWGIPWVAVRMKLIDEIHYDYTGKSTKTIQNEQELLNLIGE
ncbi:hypothetical protein FACS1894162_3670 [Bacteroidia bacterium]|nr:hypothetical protein FACS1894162_3670 [Bacteroidia bacterium]